MQKIKKILNWFYKAGISILLVIFLFLAPFTIMPNLLNTQANINRVKPYNYQGILELWHIETFEGGSVSRSSFLQKQAVAFEKQNKGTYIVIKTMTLEQLQLNLANDQMPNMISFGIGVGDGFVNNLCSLNFTLDVRPDLLTGGSFNGKQLAMPYLLGGYALISKNGFSGTTGTGYHSTTNSLKSAHINKLKLSFYDDINFDSYTAYDKFLKGSFTNLLGTQRDVYRVQNRVNKGLLNNIEYKFLSGYTDLVQYISVFKSTQQEQEICTAFIKQLLSKNTQQNIANINLFSVLQNTSLYTEDIFAKMEKCLSGNLQTENVFLTSKAIELEKNKYLKLVGE